MVDLAQMVWLGLIFSVLLVGAALGAEGEVSDTPL